jgi:hypothetical protein
VASGSLVMPEIPAQDPGERSRHWWPSLHLNTEFYVPGPRFWKPRGLGHAPGQQAASESTSFATPLDCYAPPPTEIPSPALMYPTPNPSQRESSSAGFDNLSDSSGRYCLYTRSARGRRVPRWPRSALLILFVFFSFAWR